MQRRNKEVRSDGKRLWLLATLCCVSACSSDKSSTVEPDAMASGGASGGAGAPAGGASTGGATSGGAGGAAGGATGGALAAGTGGGAMAGSAGAGTGGLMAGAGGMPAEGTGGEAGAGAAGAGGSVTADGGIRVTCSRESLRAVTEQYFQALAARDPSTLPLASTVRFTENGEPLEVGQGLWATAGAASFTLTALDTEICTSVTEAVVADGSTDIPFALRLKLENEAITEIETIAVRSGDYLVASNTDNMAAVNADEWQAPLPPDERWTREELVAYVDKYFKLFPAGACNLGSGCRRLENGFSLACTAAASCSAEEPTGEGVMTPRLHAIDVEAGIAVGFVMFLDQYTDIHLFKVRAGEVTAVHAILASASGSGWD